ncbi:MAG: phosphoribosylformylglycinamidine synthase subunit PurQ [Rhodobacteraceae bacterium]|nr:phosphoribosylformylglycinamidine synthase subunit PurQ [Paracoccaceae bacterium]
MKAAVIVFPGSNCDRDLAVAFERATGRKPAMIWHKDQDLPDGLDVIGVPGGFSFGDYLRCGAIAARSPISRALVRFAERGGHILGICNGFQILTEAGLLPGTLMRNAGLKYICRDVSLTVQTTDSAFTNAYAKGQKVTFPIAHHDGNYETGSDTLKRLQDGDRIAFTYDDNPNGSIMDIAGILSENRRVLGMMPHPERLNDNQLGGEDGSLMFQSLTQALVSA